MERVRAVTIGRVLAFDDSRQHPTVRVQPLLPRWRDDGEGIADEAIPDVPVLFPGSRGLRLDWRLADGDLVVLLLCDRPIDDLVEQMHTAQADSPQMAGAIDSRTHDLSDALALPLATYPSATQVDLLDWLRDFAALVQTATTGLGDATLAPALQVQVALMVAQLDAVR